MPIAPSMTVFAPHRNLHALHQHLPIQKPSAPRFHKPPVQSSPSKTLSLLPLSRKDSMMCLDIEVVDAAAFASLAHDSSILIGSIEPSTLPESASAATPL